MSVRINSLGELFDLAALLQEPGILFDDNPPWLSNFIITSSNLGFLRGLSGHAFELPCSALSTFSALEANTLLFLMHLIERRNYRNRYRSEVQQSYGDHNKLLMLGIDKVCAGDWRWFLSRSVFTKEEFVSELQGYIGRMHERLRDERRLWKVVTLAAAFHDYGKLYRRRYGLDSYDAPFLVDSILDALCSSPQEKAAIAFCIRHHDLVEHVANGAVPIPAILATLGRVSAQYHNICWDTLSLIQVAGAASLGNGRLTEEKLTLGQILATQRLSCPAAEHVVRINRLIFSNMSADDSELTDICRAQLQRRGLERNDFINFCDGVLLRNWDALNVRKADVNSVRVEMCFDWLEVFFNRWRADQRVADIVALSTDIKGNAMQVGETLSGDRYLVIGRASNG